VGVKKQEKEGSPRCGNCRFYWHGWCSCLFGQNDKEMRDAKDFPCGDWAAFDARRGVLADGTIWELKQ